ncbi:MAG: hypothetical protein AABZ47_14545 [Planctomycetota bacterium]
MSHREGNAVLKLTSGPLVLAVAILGLFAVVMGPLAGWMGWKQSKRALALRVPLSEVSGDAVFPYQVVRPQTLDSPVVEALGTEQYLSWVLEDASQPLNHPLRFANLFVTYYSGGHNLVPHTPDVCYLGVGYQPARPHENVEVDVNTLGPESSSVPLRICTFARTALFNREELSVAYTFYANGRFAATRNRVRVLINDLSATYAFFSKVEVSFFAGRNDNGDIRVSQWASREDTVKGAAQLFERLLPALVQKHWPEFEKAERLAKEGQ